MPKNTEGKTSLPPGKAPSHQRLGRGKLMGFGIGAEQVFGFSKGQMPWGGGHSQEPCAPPAWLCGSSASSTSLIPTLLGWELCLSWQGDRVTG